LSLLLPSFLLSFCVLQLRQLHFVLNALLLPDHLAFLLGALFLFLIVGKPLGLLLSVLFSLTLFGGFPLSLSLFVALLLILKNRYTALKRVGEQLLAILGGLRLKDLRLCSRIARGVHSESFDIGRIGARDDFPTLVEVWLKPTIGCADTLRGKLGRVEVEGDGQAILFSRIGVQPALPRGRSLSISDKTADEFSERLPEYLVVARLRAERGGAGNRDGRCKRNACKC
jgi:hypothetical protein